MTSCRKFDQLGDWFFVRHPSVGYEIFRGKQQVADGFLLRRTSGRTTRTSRIAQPICRLVIDATVHFSPEMLDGWLWLENSVSRAIEVMSLDV